MNEKVFVYYLIQALLLIFGFVMPLLKLNSNFTRLNVNLEELKKSDERKDIRITQHGKEIDINSIKIEKQEVQLDNHETRLNKLENKTCRYEESKYYREG